MRWKIRIINIGSKKTRQIKKLREYIDGIGARIAIFINELEKEKYKKYPSITIEELLSKTGDFILKLQKEIIELRRNKYSL